MHQSLFSIEDKVILITGGNSGIGFGLAQKFVELGAIVIVTGINEEKNKNTKNCLPGLGAVLKMDVRNEKEVKTKVLEILNNFNQIDVLINSAGITGTNKGISVDLNDWENVINTNLTGSFLCSRNVAQSMITNGHGGKIINIGSMFSLFGSRSDISYSTSKTGILGLTRSLALNLAKYKICVNAILPGWIITNMTKNINETTRGNQIVSKTPLNRWGTASDLEGVAIFLSSRASDFITGAYIPVDGGYSVSECLMY
jgi:2-deoxy-D-gluconate 3-dehydrogenase